MHNPDNLRRSPRIIQNTLLLAMLTLLTLTASGCKAYERIAKQTTTFANMLQISRAIQRIVEGDGFITTDSAEEIIGSIQNGNDEWGSPLIFKSRSTEEFSFILVSTGKDRKLDVDNIEYYFEVNEENIVDNFERDIVFRDGKAITIASNK